MPAVAAPPKHSLYRLLDPEVLANPYPLYERLRAETPVYWDPYLHAWVVTRYDDVVAVLQRYSAARTPAPEHLAAMGLSRLSPIAQVMVRQVLFLDPPDHGRIRGVLSRAFSAKRIEQMRDHIGTIVGELLDTVQDQGGMDIVADFAYPLPTIVTAELLGVPRSDSALLQGWSVSFAEILGNFQYNPERIEDVLAAVEGMIVYFREKMLAHRQQPGPGLIGAFIDAAEADGSGLSDDDIIANLILMMVAGQETTTNLITGGMLILLRHPEALAAVRADNALLPGAVEEILRYEGASHLTARIAHTDIELRGQHIRKGQAVIAVVGAANRDPDRFPEPDRFDIRRPDNRHLAFGWGSHFCSGAPLARLEAQISYATILRRFPALALATDQIRWRTNAGLRGLTALPVTF